MKNAGVIDRIFELCRFARLSMFEVVSAETRSEVELALQLDEQQLGQLYTELRYEEDCPIAEQLRLSCELGLAACQVIRGVLWDIGGTAAYREAEEALQQAKELFLAATEALRQSAQSCLVFA